MDDENLQLILVDTHINVCAAWQKAFAGLPNVSIASGGFEHVPEWDAIVAPGNSYGIMDGGLDLAIARYYQASGCDDLQARLHQAIATFHNGELPVGAAIVINPYRRPWMVYAPTMRIPMDIRGTENVYLAMKAALEAFETARRFLDRPMTTLLVPGLGMGTGRVPPDEGARQMALAYEYWLYPPEQMTWGMAVGRHKRIRGEG